MIRAQLWRGLEMCPCVAGPEVTPTMEWAAKSERADALFAERSHNCKLPRLSPIPAITST